MSGNTLVRLGPGDRVLLESSTALLSPSLVTVLFPLGFSPVTPHPPGGPFHLSCPIYAVFHLLGITCGLSRGDLVPDGELQV